MAINLSDNIKVSAPKPVESKYLNITIPYTGSSQVNTCIASGERYEGLTVNISNVEYWYNGGIADSCLVLKSGGGTWGTITGTLSGQTDLWNNLVTLSAATPTSSWSGLTGLPTDNPDLMTVFSGYSLTGHTHSNYELVTSINTYTGTTAPNQFLGKVAFTTYSGTTVPNTYLGKTAFSTYSGTTVPATYYNKTQINVYTGTTVPATYALKSLALTGGTSMGGTTLLHLTPVATNKLQLKGLAVGGTGLSIVTGATTNTISGATTDIFTTVTDLFLLRRNGTAMTGYSINNFATSAHLHTGVYSPTGHTHATLYAPLSAYQTYTGTTVPSTYAPLASPNFTTCIGIIGNIRFASGATRTIRIGATTTTVSHIIISGQTLTGLGNAGNVCIIGGCGIRVGGGSTYGGDLFLIGGDSCTTCSSYGGNVYICGGDASISGTGTTCGGNVYILGGMGSGGVGTFCCGYVVLYHGCTAKLCTVTNGICIGTNCGFGADWIATSDIRLKKDIQPISNALSIITQLQGVCYHLCDDECCENRIGLIAQDVIKILPEIVSHSVPDKCDIKYSITDDKLGISYGKITAVLIEAVKILNEKLIQLEQDLNYIKNNNT